jgi:hypothetical protein
MKTTAKPVSEAPADAERQLGASSISSMRKVRRFFKRCSKIMRQRFPTANELVYDNGKFL